MKQQHARAGGRRNLTTSRGRLSYALIAAVLFFVGGVLFAASQLDAAQLSPSIPDALGRGSGHLGLVDDFTQKTAGLGSGVVDLLREELGLPPTASSASSNQSTFCRPWPLCALTPREPDYFPLCDLLTDWSPDDPDVRKYSASQATRATTSTTHHQPGLLDGHDPLPVFNFSDPAERVIAAAWRKAEVPFMLKGVPDLDRAKQLWASDAFLRESFANTEYKVERAVRKNHFLYYTRPHSLAGRLLRGGGGGGGRAEKGNRAEGGAGGVGGGINDWQAPQVTQANMKYEEFEAEAIAADNSASEAAALSASGGATPTGSGSSDNSGGSSGGGSSGGRDNSAGSSGSSVGSGSGSGIIGEATKALYLTVSASMGGRTKWIVDSLPFFRDNHDFFRVNYPEPFHGINCRFGMRGVVQAAHYDHGRNFIAMVKGHKRYVISPPRVCQDLELLSHGNPSARHASFDWADPEELAKRQGSKFCNAKATEVVLGEGQMLYLPSFWFHYIVSLDRTAQCNSRAGNSDSGAFEIAQCMRQSTTDTATGF